VGGSQQDVRTFWQHEACDACGAGTDALTCRWLRASQVA
jgi:hypothetical protein